MSEGRKAAIYVRISRDREGAGLGVQRQEQDCRELAERLGWHVVGVYPDNDVSASDRPSTSDQRRVLQAVLPAQRNDAMLAVRRDLGGATHRREETVLRLPGAGAGAQRMPERSTARHR